MTRPLPPNISASIDHFKKVHHVKQCFPFQQLKTKVYLRTFNDYKCIDFKLFAISLGRWTVEHSCERLKNKQKHNVNLFRVWISTHFLSVKMPEKTDKSLSVFFFFWLPFEIAGGLTIPQMNSTFHVKMIYSRQICYTGLHCFMERSHVFKNWKLFWKRGSPLVRCFTFNSVKHKIIEGVFRWKRFKRGLSLWIY